MSIKKELGQFFTTNYNYILQGMEIPSSITNIIEPFAGDGDLLKFIKDKSKYNIECYDIEPKKDYIIKMDTILNPPNYKNKFLLKNPPYLAKNKTKSREHFDKYDVDDLYKCLIAELLNKDNMPNGGIIIIPLNFWSSIRISDIELRRRFIKIYNVIRVNIFEEQVFDDTSYTICSIQFELKTTNNNEISFYIYPSKKSIKYFISR